MKESIANFGRTYVTSKITGTRKSFRECPAKCLYDCLTLGDTLMSEKKPNYSPELTAQIVEAYAKGKTDAERVQILEELSAETKRPVRAIRAKLVSLGVYIKVKPVSKVTGGKPETKETIVSGIARLLDVAPAMFDSLDNATKKTLCALRDSIKAELARAAGAD